MPDDVVPRHLVRVFHGIVGFQQLHVVVDEVGGVVEQAQVIFERGVNAVDNHLAAVVAADGLDFLVYRVPVGSVQVRRCQPRCMLRAGNAPYSE